MSPSASITTYVPRVQPEHHLRNLLLVYLHLQLDDECPGTLPHGLQHCLPIPLPYKERWYLNQVTVAVILHHHNGVKVTSCLYIVVYHHEVRPHLLRIEHLVHKLTPPTPLHKEYHLLIETLWNNQLVVKGAQLRTLGHRHLAHHSLPVWHIAEVGKSVVDGLREQLRRAGRQIHLQCAQTHPQQQARYEHIRHHLNNIYPMHAMYNHVEEVYNAILEEYEMNHLVEREKKKIFTFFQEKIASKFNLPIKMDNVIAKALIHRLQANYEKEKGSTKFIDLLSAAKRIEQALRQFSYIDTRTSHTLNGIFNQYERSPNIKLSVALDYLKNSDSLREFRYEFLTKVIQMPLNEEEVNEMTAKEDLMQVHYREFWTDGWGLQNYDRQILGYLYQTFCKFENKQDMLTPTMMQQINKKVTQTPGLNRKQIEINRRLLQIAEANALDNNPEFMEQINVEVAELQTMLRRFAGLNIFSGFKMHLSQFGSIISGFASRGADLDLTILTNSYVEESGFMSLLADYLSRQYTETYRDTTKAVQVVYVSVAATPLIALSISYDRTSRKKISIDLLLNNALGIINSSFLHVYSQVRWIRNLGLLIKAWGKNNGLIEKSKFSSYSLILMLIHFLIRTRRANVILDHANRLNQPHFIFKRIKQGEEEKFEVYYKFKHKKEDVTLSERENYLAILTQFTLFYGQTIFEEKDQLITVDNGTKLMHLDYIYTIKDPFDKPHNPARVKVQHKQWIINRFMESHKILKRGDITQIQRLFNC